MSDLGSPSHLLGRRKECDRLESLLSGVRGGRGGVLVIRGGAGVGKTALLDHAVRRAVGCTVARSTGVESEAELAYAGLQQLCAPFLGRMPALPVPQRTALRIALGLERGAAPDPFLTGLATLTLLTEVSLRQPLVCVVDDAQWLDRESARALGFVARRVSSPAIVMIFAARGAAPGGELAGLPELTMETRELSGGELVPYGEIGLLALRGDPDVAEPAIGAFVNAVSARHENAGLTFAAWCRAVLYNGLGRYEDARNAAKVAAENPLELGAPQWALGELVEASVHTGDRSDATSAQATLAAFARSSGTHWAMGVAASKGALLADGADSEALHREALLHLSRTGVRVELARAHLLYGEWLRREGRRADARVQLSTAHDALSGMGVDAFASRAHRELVATGQGRRLGGSTAQLTSQESTVARLAAQGLTSPEIGAALYISSRTVEWHLRNVFAKLGVRTRRELRRSLPSTGRVAT